MKEGGGRRKVHEKGGKERGSEVKERGQVEGACRQEGSEGKGERTRNKGGGRELNKGGKGLEERTSVKEGGKETI